MSSFSPQREVQRLQNKIDVETKIKDGAENLLTVFDLKLGSSAKVDLRKQIESELDSANTKIAALKNELERWQEVQRAISPAPSSTTEYQSHPDSWASWDLGTNTVSRLEQSALGLDGQPLFAQDRPDPSRRSEPPSTSSNIAPSLLEPGDGSPPSTNYVKELTTSTDGASVPFGGLGLGLDGNSGLQIAGVQDFATAPTHRPAPLLYDHSSSNTAAAALDRDSDADRENEDARASRSLAISLIRTLRPVSPRPPLAKLPTLSEDASAADASFATLNTDAADTTAFSHNPDFNQDFNQDSPMRGNIGLPRVNRRAAARTRAAALASGVSGHARTPSNAAGLGDEAKQQIDQMNRLVDILKRHARVRYELPLDELVDSVTPCLCDQAGKEVRASAYRLLRHALVQPLWPLISRCRSKGLDIYLSRTLIRDNRFEVEKVQAIKLIRAIMELSALRTVHAAPDRLALDLEELIAVGVIRTMAAVAEHSEDKLRYLCLETLAELAVFDIRLLIKGGGLRATLQALTEGPIELSPTLIQIFIYLVDMPRTRSYLRPGIDLEVAMSGLTEVPAQKPLTYDALLRSSARVVSVMLRAWTGLIYMCMNNKRAIKSLVQALRVNPVEVKDVILDMLYDLFNVRGVSGSIDPASKRESGQKTSASPKIDSEAPTSNTGAKLGDLGDQPRTRLNLVDHYLALVLVIFIESGLVDALVDVIEHAPTMARKATLLIGELLQVSKRVHPPSLGQSIHSLPHLFSLAANFNLEKSDERQAATSALSSIDHVNRQRAHHEALVSAAALSGTKQSTSRDRSNSVEDSMRRGQRQVEKTKIRMGMQIDEVQFRNMMVDTQVLATKDHVRWNLDTLTEMLEGPLLNPKRLEDAVKGTKLLKRVLSFFHPFALRFSSIRKIPSNRRFVRLGCLLLTTLSSTTEGVRVLTEDRLLREIRECLDQLDPLSGAPVSDPLMSRNRLQETLTYGYFEMIGVLTQTVDGIRLLERFKMFTPLYHLSELRSRDDIVKAVIENVDYSIDGHSRIILSKALTSNYRDVRLFATKYLVDLIRQYTLPTIAKSALDAQNDWTISLLLTQLYDPSVEVRKMAVRVLDEACTVIQILEKVVSMRPTLDHLGDLGHPLLLKFLSTSVGIRYLWQGEYIDREMDEWFNERNQRYTVKLEVKLANFFSIYRKQGSSSVNDNASDTATEAQFDGTAPPHFYGELTKTREGCQILKQKGHFAEFAHFIRQHGTEHSDAELINKLKSVLWAVGNIGANALGLPFLEAEDVISQIVEIAENSEVLSVRGTCFFVLGLISSTSQGAETLQDYGWQSVCTPLGVPMGLCVPEDVDRLVMIPKWTVPKINNLSYLNLAQPETVVENKIITSIANLGNSILAANASRTLTKLKAKHKSSFQDMSILARAIELMDSFYYRLPVRRHIWELFEVNLNEDVVRAVQLSKEKLIEAKKQQQQKRHSRNANSKMETDVERASSAMSPLGMVPKQNGNGQNAGNPSGFVARHAKHAGLKVSMRADSDDSDVGSDFAGDETEESDGEDGGVGLSSNLSSDDEESDTSQEDSKEQLGQGIKVARMAAVKGGSKMRSSKSEGSWSRQEEEHEPERVISQPMKKVVGFGAGNL